MEEDEKGIADLERRIKAADYAWKEFQAMGCKRQAAYWRDRATDLATDLAWLKGYLVKR